MEIKVIGRCRLCNGVLLKDDHGRVYCPKCSGKIHLNSIYGLKKLSAELISKRKDRFVFKTDNFHITVWKNECPSQLVQQFENMKLHEKTTLHISEFYRKKITKRIHVFSARLVTKEDFIKKISRKIDEKISSLRKALDEKIQKAEEYAKDGVLHTLTAFLSSVNELIEKLGSEGEEIKERLEKLLSESRKEQTRRKARRLAKKGRLHEDEDFLKKALSSFPDLKEEISQLIEKSKNSRRGDLVSKIRNDIKKLNDVLQERNVSYAKYLLERVKKILDELKELGFSDESIEKEVDSLEEKYHIFNAETLLKKIEEKDFWPSKLEKVMMESLDKIKDKNIVDKFKMKLEEKKRKFYERKIKEILNIKIPPKVSANTLQKLGNKVRIFLSLVNRANKLLKERKWLPQDLTAEIETIYKEIKSLGINGVNEKIEKIITDLYNVSLEYVKNAALKNDYYGFVEFGKYFLAIRAILKGETYPTLEEYIRKFSPSSEKKSFSDLIYDSLISLPELENISLPIKTPRKITLGDVENIEIDDTRKYLVVFFNYEDPRYGIECKPRRGEVIKPSKPKGVGLKEVWLVKVEKDKTDKSGFRLSIVEPIRPLNLATAIELMKRGVKGEGGILNIVYKIVRNPSSFFRYESSYVWDEFPQLKDYLRNWCKKELPKFIDENWHRAKKKQEYLDIFDLWIYENVVKIDSDKIKRIQNAIANAKTLDEAKRMFLEEMKKIILEEIEAGKNVSLEPLAGTELADVIPEFVEAKRRKISESKVFKAGNIYFLHELKEILGDDVPEVAFKDEVEELLDGLKGFALPQIIETDKLTDVDKAMLSNILYDVVDYENLKKALKKAKIKIKGTKYELIRSLIYGVQ